MKLNLIFKKNILGIFLLLIISSGLTALPAKAADLKECPDDAIKLSTYIPGLEKCIKKGIPLISNDETYYYIQNLAEYIVILYDFALAASGILALVMITFGGYLWLTAGGNPSRVGKAKEFIVSAITGLILALGAFTILYFINPKIVSPNLSVAQTEPILPIDKFCENIKYPTLDIRITPASGRTCGEIGTVELLGFKNTDDAKTKNLTLPILSKNSEKGDKTICQYKTCTNGGFCVELSALSQEYRDSHTGLISIKGYVCAK
jgi:hypothetical protein